MSMRVGPIGLRNSQPRQSLIALLSSIIVAQKLMEASDFYGRVESSGVSFAKKVVLMREHHPALFHWAQALKEQRINYNCVLIHFDAHPDLKESFWPISPGVLGPDGYPVSRERAFEEATRQVRENDNYPDMTPEERFIKSAIELKIVGEYVHIIPGDDGCFETPNLSVPSKVLTLDQAMQQLSFLPDKQYIFDLDLDFFSNLADMPYDRQATILQDLPKMLQLLALANPPLFTIAFSQFSTSQIKQYLTISEEECCKIIAAILEQLQLGQITPDLITEPRRSIRHSPK